MFSGIIERIGTVAAVEAAGDGLRLTIDCGWDDLALGESVAVNGVCLTVAALADGGRADMFLSAETLARSNLGGVATGTALNLERAVTLATRLSGHLVQGHVDGVATVAGIVDDGEAHRVRFALPPALRRYCVEKGSIAFDGISLTINEIAGESADGFAVGVTLIPHSWANTNLRHAAVGDRINVEVDVLGKYVEQLCRPYPTPLPA